MSTNSEVLQDALGLIGVTDDFTISAEYGALGLRAMNDLLTMWLDNGIDTGYFEQGNLTDTNPVPAENMMAVKYNLAIALAPYFSASPSIALIADASKSYQHLLRKAQVAKQVPVDVRHAPQSDRFGPGYNIITDI